MICLLQAKTLKKANNLKEKLHVAFEMKDLWEVERILGMDILRDKSHGKLFLSKKGYIQKVLRRYCMHQAKAVSTSLRQ